MSMLTTKIKPEVDYIECILTVSFHRGSDLFSSFDQYHARVQTTIVFPLESEHISATEKR